MFEECLRFAGAAGISTKNPPLTAALNPFALPVGVIVRTTACNYKCGKIDSDFIWLLVRISHS